MAPKVQAQHPHAIRWQCEWTYAPANAPYVLNQQRRQTTLAADYMFASPSEAMRAVSKNEQAELVGKFTVVPIRRIGPADFKAPRRDAKPGDRVGMWPFDTYHVEWWPEGT